MAPRVLVVGAGGLLGRHLQARGVPGLDHGACDVTDPVARERALRRFRPDAVLFCAAVSDVDRCERDPGTWRVNVEAPAAWARYAPVWLVSSNFVFSGPGPHGPGHPPRPVNAYGRQKAAAEEEVRGAGGHVVRTGWLFGAGGRNFPSRLPDALARNPVRVLAGVPVQPTWAGDVADRLLALPEGISHAVGGAETEWVEVAREIARRCGLPASRVIPIPPQALALAAARPPDARLAPADLPGWSERLAPFLAGALLP